jgi:hypothetical protein
LESDLFYKALGNYNSMMSNGWMSDETGRAMEVRCRGLIEDTTLKVYRVTAENSVIHNND